MNIVMLTRESVVPQLKGLLAYPYLPSEIGQIFQAAANQLCLRTTTSNLKLWEENDIAGRCIVDPILAAIDDGNILIADITVPNLNVT